MALAIRNNARSMLTFNLGHDVDLPGASTRVETVERTSVDRHGRSATQRKRLRHPPVLTLRAGETIENLPESIRTIPAIRRALADDTLSIVAVAEKRDEAEAADEPKPEGKPSKRQDKKAADGHLVAEPEPPLVRVEKTDKT